MENNHLSDRNLKEIINLLDAEESEAWCHVSSHDYTSECGCNSYTMIETIDILREKIDKKEYTKADLRNCLKIFKGMMAMTVHAAFAEKNPSGSGWINPPKSECEDRYLAIIKRLKHVVNKKTPPPNWADQIPTDQQTEEVAPWIGS